jgi:hypothetical protein
MNTPNLPESGSYFFSTHKIAQFGLIYDWLYDLCPDGYECEGLDFTLDGDRIQATIKVVKEDDRGVLVPFNMDWNDHDDVKMGALVELLEAEAAFEEACK